MKQRERIKQIRKEGTWSGKLALAADKRPGTEFDEFIHKMQMFALPNRLVLRGKKLVPSDPKKDGPPLADIQGMVDAVANGDLPWLKRLAKAVKAYHRHQSNPDKLRLALVRLRPNPNDGRTMVEVLNMLSKLKVITKSQADDASVERQVSRLCREVDLKIIDKRGRPKKGTREARKRSR